MSGRPGREEAVLYGPIPPGSRGTQFESQNTTAPRPRGAPRAEHPISRAEISPSALKVMYRLKDAGYQSFLVGGAVRDLLLGLDPKDFDSATNALPDGGLRRSATAS